MKEDILTQHLIDQLKNGGLKKLTRLQKHAKFRRELGDKSFRADIFISFSKEDESSPEKFDRRATHFIAIEVKVKDWKQGLYQAWRYNTFAERSFLALYKKYAGGVDRRLFQQYNVGLIIFDETTIKVLNSPRHNRFNQQSYSERLRMKLWQKLAAMESAEPAF